MAASTGLSLGGLRLVGAAPASPVASPAFITSASTLGKIRKRRRTRKLAEDLYTGKWRRALLDAKRSQHQWRKVQKIDGRIDTLLEKVNLVKRAMDMRADIIASRAPRISVDPADSDQSVAIDEIKRRSLFDAIFHEAVLSAAVDAESFLRVDVTPTGEVVVRLDDPNITLPVGVSGPDGQPEAFERRWVVERDGVIISREKIRYLRVERHRVIDGVGVVEQEAYETTSIDTVVDLSTLTRVDLSKAMPLGVDPPAEVVATGASHPAIVQVVSWRRHGQPGAILSEDTLDLVDASAAHFSSLSRAMGMHGTPRVRVPAEYVNPDGVVRPVDNEAIVDPNKEFEYVRVEFMFNEMLSFLDKLLFVMFIELEGSPALIGLRPDGAGTVTSAAQLRIESTGALSSARRSSPHLESALERLFDVASQIDSALPLRGYAVAPVSVTVTPDLPLSMIDIAREQDELVTAGLTSRRRAIAAIHGEDAVDQIISEIEADQAAASAQQRDALFGAVPSLGNVTGGGA